MKILVVIPVLNNIDGLEKCLHALSQQTYKYFSTVVVDNNSTQNIKPLCDRYLVRYLYEPKQSSYAARNKAIDTYPQMDVYAFTDSDCVPDQRWIERGIKALAQSDGIVAGQIVMTFENEYPTPIEYLDYRSHLRNKEYASQGFAATANAFISAKVFYQHGLFNSNLLNLGDREFGRRTKVCVKYAPDAFIFHPARSTVETLFSKIIAQAKCAHNIRNLDLYTVLTGLNPTNEQALRVELCNSDLETPADRIAFVYLFFVKKLVIAYYFLISIEKINLEKLNESSIGTSN